MDTSGKTSSRLTVCLFGCFEVLVNGEPLPKWRTRKEKWLLALLVLAHGRVVTRQELIRKLWPEAEERFPLDPGYNLRRSLMHLRRALGEEASRLTSPEPGVLRLDLTNAYVDILAFDTLVAHPALLTPSKIEDLAALYRGSLLSECTEEWADSPRLKYQQTYHKALLHMGERALQVGDNEGALRCLREAAGLNRTSEQTCRAQMQALAKLGRYEEALRLYEELARHLQHTLHSAPDPESTQMFHNIAAMAHKKAAQMGVTSRETMDGQGLHRQQRYQQVFARAFEEWKTFNHRETFLLPAEKILLAVQYLQPALLSREQAEYLLLSVLHLGALPVQTVEQVRAFVAALRDTDALWERILSSRDARIRYAAIHFLSSPLFLDVLATARDRITKEPDRDVKRALVHALHLQDISLPLEMAEALLQEHDWKLRSYALKSLPAIDGCLLLGDRTEFAQGLGELVQASGFTLVTGPQAPVLPPSEILEAPLWSAYKLVVLVRGEHFSFWGNSVMYARLRQFVAEGGVLFATSWVSWETAGSGQLAEVLPFAHICEEYREEVYVHAQATKSDQGQELFPDTCDYIGSLEGLQAREDAVVWAETPEGVPLLGWRRFGQGGCCYFNTCQHTCFGKMLSPLQTSPVLQKNLGRVFAWIHKEVQSRSAPK